MKLVYVCCCSGNSSSVFCKKTIAALQDNRIYFMCIEEAIKQYERLSASYDVLLAYGSAELFSTYFMHKRKLDEYIDVVWMFPQARYLKATVEAQLAHTSIPIRLLDMQLMMHGEFIKMYEDMIQEVDTAM